MVSIPAGRELVFPDTATFSPLETFGTIEFRKRFTLAQSDAVAGTGFAAFDFSVNSGKNPKDFTVHTSWQTTYAISQWSTTRVRVVFAVVAPSDAVVRATLSVVK
ncbi:hypothetical protein D9M73_240930 [compost metagenome]